MVTLDGFWYAAGYLVLWHLIINKYTDLEQRRRPTHSIIMRSNGWVTAEIGHNRASPMV